MGASTQYQRASETGAKTQNTEFLAADIIPDVDDGKATILRVTVAVTVTDAVIEVTYDSGTAWIAINSGVAIPVGQLFAFDLSGFNKDDLVNFRASNASGTTLTIFRVDAIPN